MAGGQVLFFLMMATGIAGAQLPPPAYSCCERNIKFQQAIFPEVYGAPRVTPGPPFVLEGVFKFPISFECQDNIGDQCIGTFDVAVERSPLQADNTGAFTIAPAPVTAEIIGYPQEACDGRMHNDLSMFAGALPTRLGVRWQATSS
jgi:hypothetical protein